MIRSLAVLAAIAVTRLAIALPTSMTLAFTEFDLPNGLHVIVHEDHTAPLVAVDVRYHVGSKNEQPGKTGFAHLFEHLMFDGSKNVGRLMFDKYLTNVGAENNAYTTADETNYHEVVPVNQLELVLWLESDRMMQFAIKPVSLKTQKEVVKEEKRQTDDNRPYGSLEEKMHALAYTAGCYRWPVIGSMEDIDRATMDDVREFFETYYVPNNATLCLVGDITVDEGRRLAERWFGDIAPGTRPFNRPMLTLSPQTAAREETLKDDVPTPGSFATYHTPPEGSPDLYPLELLTSILGSGESSRLHHRLVYEAELASEASCYVDPGELASLFYVYAIAAEPGGDIKKLEDEMFAVVDSIARNGVSERELMKAKNQKEAQLVFGISGALGRADALTHAHMILGNTAAINTQITKYEQVTAADIQRVARTYLAPGARNIVRYIPKEEGK